MADDSFGTTPRGWLRAIREWMTGTTPASHGSSTYTIAPTRVDAPARVAHYTIERKLGEGGMGVVFAARDERLGRSVAIKLMSSLSDDDTARRRFWREARAAASVNHPNICQLYEVGEDRGELFIAMELLEGEPLNARMARGALTVSEALPIGHGVLAALSALHARGILHRDLKPSNVFLTAHGVKLLDFGLARPADPAQSRSLDSSGILTQSGVLIGTPGYMAPEQLLGEELDVRCDLFAAGAILFEMLAGRPAFFGYTFVDILAATMHEQPPALTGSPAVAAVDRVIRRALSKRAADRPATADAMAEELRAAGGVGGKETATLARPLTRLVVLPFRVLRPDPEIDFLAFSLPDAIATSLSGITSLVVRSSATAARYVGESPDLKAIAAEADVDRVVMGTLLRSGNELRAAAQLVEAPGGTLLTSHTVQASLGDLFRLQDDLVRRVTEALALPLGRQDASPMPSPRDPRAYELYLRGNELARRYHQLPEARALYQRCLEIDPGFAPAWAQLARCHRVIGKFIEASPDSEERAEEALRRALELNPRLAVAHKFYAQLEADMGKGPQALVRLLGEADRHGNDPELFAGLVHVCRYCGLFDQSIAAHEEARRLDPNVPTSFEQTILMTCDIDRLLAVERKPLGTDGDEDIRAIGLALAGQRDEARRHFAEILSASGPPLFRSWTEYLLAWAERRTAGAPSDISEFRDLKIWGDPEAVFQEGWLLCDIGDYERGLDRLRRAVDKGYFVAPTLAVARAFDAVRRDARFSAILAKAEAGRDRAMRAFREHGGERLLGR